MLFNNKTLMITGGTGSFGGCVLAQMLRESFSEIRIYSRDEKKQNDQRVKFNDTRLKYYIGDVRDQRAVANAMRGVDFVFHSAALKQVPSCEFYPMEAVKTNVLGTENVLDAAIQSGVSRVICLSTDKAVYPVNAMGISKAMMEKVMVAKSREARGTKTIICGTRYGNVLASRGSVVPLFFQQLSQGRSLTVTDPNMTRFVMTLEQAVDLVMYAFEHGGPGDIFVQKAPAVTVADLAQAVLVVTNKKGAEIRTIGTRHGEKLFETLLSREEMAVAADLGNYFQVKPDNRDLNYEQYFSGGEQKFSLAEDFNSHNTKRLGVDEMVHILRNLSFVKSILEKGSAALDEAN